MAGKTMNQKEDGCYICGRTDCLELHHIFNKYDKRKAEEDGFLVWLCHTHHNTPEGVHYRRQMRQYFQAKAQQIYEQEHSHEEWMARYKKNYI